MQFINEAPLYKIIRITGPKHNLLGLELCTEPVDLVTLEALDETSSTKSRVDANNLVVQVMAGIDRAQNTFGKRFHVKRIQYVSSDTPSSTVYTDLTVEILLRVKELQNHA